MTDVSHLTPSGGQKHPGPIAECTYPQCSEWAHRAASSEPTEMRTDAWDLWWLATAQRDVAAMSGKVGEYGAIDLRLIGQVLQEIGPGLAKLPNDEAVHTELGTFFYLLGKVARMASAYKEGRAPIRDTLDDGSVYATMMRRIRTAGGWPNAEKE